MSKQNADKPGWIHTPLGWIPEAWEVKEVLEIAPLQRGFDLTNGNLIKGKFPVVYSNGILNYHCECRAKAPGVVTGRSGTIGKVCFVEQDYWPHNTSLWVTDFKGNDPKFIYYFYVNLRLERFGSGSGVPTLNRNDVHEHVTILPTLVEQRRIAAILSTWDEAITKTRELIAQLQQRNKGLMQQLLTGKKRLKGFEGEWKKLYIHEIAKEVSLKNKNGKDLTVLSCTKYGGLVPSLEYFGRRVFGSDTSTYKVVPQHHFAYATNHIEEGSIGYQNLFEEALISPMYTVFKTNEQVHDEYLFKLLKSHHYIHQYCKRMEGSIDRRGGLRWDEFSKIIIHLPELEEQKAIAYLLKNAEEEKNLYEEKLAALQQQKKGLMQKLLTGEVRVKLN